VAFTAHCLRSYAVSHAVHTVCGGYNDAEANSNRSHPDLHIVSRELLYCRRRHSATARLRSVTAVLNLNVKSLSFLSTLEVAF